MAKSKSFCTSFNKINKWVRLLLTILFDVILGGIYRICSGKVVIGIIWILTMGLFGIGWILDAITTVLNGKYTILA